MEGTFYGEIAELLGIHESALRELDRVMSAATGRTDVIARMREMNTLLIRSALPATNARHREARDARRTLQDRLLVQEERLRGYVAAEDGADEFEKAARLARRIARAGKGFFLKESYIGPFLKAFPPEHLLQYLGYASVDELLAREKIAETMSALRFMESDEWMHRFFDHAYSALTPSDFEERDITIEVLGPRWREIAERFVAKKHHNVSHLKELGVIFLNPIAEETHGKFIRDFALLLHYFHEIDFYALLFRREARGARFAERLKSLLRGDVPDAARLGGSSPSRADWLIIQRYLVKENPNDPRLLLPRVNPESLHWCRAERDLVAFGKAHPDTGLAMWEHLDWVGMYMPEEKGSRSLVSFDFEDTAMSLVSREEGKQEYFTYHEREALWTALFQEYVGGEEAMAESLLAHFERGVISFP